MRSFCENKNLTHEMIQTRSFKIQIQRIDIHDKQQAECSCRSTKYIPKGKRYCMYNAEQENKTTLDGLFRLFSFRIVMRF